MDYSNFSQLQLTNEEELIAGISCKKILNHYNSEYLVSMLDEDFNFKSQDEINKNRDNLILCTLNGWKKWEIKITSKRIIVFYESRSGMSERYTIFSIYSIAEIVENLDIHERYVKRPDFSYENMSNIKKFENNYIRPRYQINIKHENGSLIFAMDIHEIQNIEFLSKFFNENTLHLLK